MSINCFLIDFISISISSFCFLVDFTYSSSFVCSCCRNYSINWSFWRIIYLHASFWTSMSCNKIFLKLKFETYLSQFFTIFLFLKFLPCPIDFDIFLVTGDNLILDHGTSIISVITLLQLTYLSFLVFSSCMRLWFSAASVLDLILTIVSEVSFLICSKNPIKL